MPAPGRFADYLREFAYHPRSSRHGDALCKFILDDLLGTCPDIAEHARQGKVVYDLRRKIKVGGGEWNIDLVLGPPPSPGPSISAGDRIPRTPPATIRIAIESKSVMTEHQKAQRNRLRDLDSFHQFIHRYDPQTITASVTIINISPMFRSPLRPKVTKHVNPRALVETTIGLLRTLPQRAGIEEGAGLEANCVIVVSHDNVPPHRSRFVTELPAPQVGDPLHYDSFLQRICDRYRQRFR